MSSLVRESALGQIIRWATGNKVLPYPEEKPDFQLPEAWVQVANSNLHDAPSSRPEFFENSNATSPSISSSSADEENQIEKVDTVPSGHARDETVQLARTKTREETVPYTQERLDVDRQHDLEKTKSIPIVPRKTKDGAILVDWYYSDDPENPQNWSNARRAMVTIVICLYTFVVYMSSAIYTTSEPGIMEEFGVDETHAALGLSLFVLG